MSTGLKKYEHYIKIKHEWQGMNCVTLIVDIYNRFLNIDLKECLSRAGTDGVTNIDAKWYQIVPYETIINEINNWKKINLRDIQEYDILIFRTKNMRHVHFGMYIEAGTYIHLPFNGYATFKLLNEDDIKILIGCYRHYDLV